MTNPGQQVAGATPLSAEDKAFLLEKVEYSSDLLRQAREKIATIFWGQDEIIDLTLACMVAGGHLLAEGVPGVGKTHFISNVANVMGLGFNRVQFTPDLMPSGILGSSVRDKVTGDWKFEKGPVFSQFMMADEINRAGPKTQSALLEAMQEKQVTVDGMTYALPRPFHVMATQNPIEQEGTYPLPEAQRDRFMMRLDFDYPNENAERRVMIETTKPSGSLRDVYNKIAAGQDLTAPKDGSIKKDLTPVLGKYDLIAMQELAKHLPISKAVEDAAIYLVRNLRPQNKDAPEYVKNNVRWGPGPRAVQTFASVARARALIAGKLAPDVTDIIAVAAPVLQHRTEMKSKRDQAEGFNAVLSQLVKQL